MTYFSKTRLYFTPSLPNLDRKGHTSWGKEQKKLVTTSKKAQVSESLCINLRIPKPYVVVMTGDYGKQSGISVKPYSDYYKDNPCGWFCSQRLTRVTVGCRPEANNTISIHTHSWKSHYGSAKPQLPHSGDLLETRYCHRHVSKLSHTVTNWRNVHQTFTSH